MWRDMLSPECIHFAIADVGVGVRSDLQELLAELAALYPQSSDRQMLRKTIFVEVRETSARLGRRRYRVYADNREIGGNLRRDEVYPFVEWAINLRVIATRSEYVQLHAASMANDGNGFIFAGGSGSGKSTLAAGLMARGWNYLCDEFELIDRNTLCLKPFPKPLCIKAGAFPVLKRLGLPFARRRDYIKSQKGRVGYINPNDVQGHRAARSAPVRFVIFPMYAEKQPPRLYPISRARALMDLAGCVFNRHVFDDQGLSILSKVIRRAECHRLEMGDLAETCDLLEAQLGHTPAFSQSKSMPATNMIARSPDDNGKATGSFLSRRTMLKRSAKLAYVAPVVLALSSQKAFAAGSNPSGICSTALNTGELCETDSDCCTNDCDLGVCK